MSMPERPSLLEFPTSFPLKAIGTGPHDLEALVVDIVGQHVSELAPDCASTRLSGGGKYLAVTVTFTAESQAQLDAIYTDLKAHDRIVMLL